MNVREEKDTDIVEITNIHNQAFKGSVEGKIVKNLRKNKNLTISLVCEMENKIVGHIAYSPMYVKNGTVGLGLAPVAVLPEFQKQGIGSALINKGNEIAFSKGFSKIFVLGEPDYYPKFNFEPAKKYNHFSKFDPEGNYFMVLGNNLEVASERIEVQYGKEFDV